MKLKRYGGIFALCFLLPVVSGCSDKANRLALNDRLLFTQGRGPLAGSVVVGEVTGGSVQLLNPYGISNDEYKEALTLSLRANHLIAEDPMAAQYRIEAMVDFERSGIFDKEVDGKVDYRLLSNATHDVLFEQTIESKATTKSALEENAGAVVALLFTSRQDNDAAWEATYVRSARDNLSRFFDALSNWTPPSKAEPSISETAPRVLSIPTAAFRQLGQPSSLN